MKRFVLVLLAFLLCLSLFSCEGDVITPLSSGVISEVSSEDVLETSSQEVTNSESVSSVEDTSLKPIDVDEVVTLPTSEIQVTVGKKIFTFKPMQENDGNTFLRLV